MTLWRVHLRPDYGKGINPVDVCLRQEVVGIGWRVPTKPSTWDEYWALGKKEYGDRGWSKAANAVGSRMAVGDIVWVRDFCGYYYVGKISGGWEYRDDPENLEADIVNVRPCKLFKVATSVAGKIVNCFIPRATVQQIHDDTAELFSTFVFNRGTGGNLPLVPQKGIDIFSLLSDVDLEDVVALYLQHTKGLLLIPSSRSRQDSTIFYEYQLLNPKSGKATYVQVKSGNITLNPSQYYNFPDEIYLFSPAGYSQQSTQNHVICIDRAAIESFLISARNFLPHNISVWLDMLAQLNTPIVKTGSI